jgi:hypothetical protein
LIYQRKGLGLQIPKEKLQLSWSSGAVPSFKSCTAYIISWTKEANDTESKTIFIQGKKNAKERLWKLIIVSQEPEDITAVDDEMYKDVSAQVRESEVRLIVA